jgi:hypothetical protein
MLTCTIFVLEPLVNDPHLYGANTSERRSTNTTASNPWRDLHHPSAKPQFLVVHSLTNHPTRQFPLVARFTFVAEALTGSQRSAWQRSYPFETSLRIRTPSVPGTPKTTIRKHPRTNGNISFTGSHSTSVWMSGYLVRGSFSRGTCSGPGPSPRQGRRRLVWHRKLRARYHAPNRC